MPKLTFAVGVPVKGQRYTVDKNGNGSWVPHIHHRELYFNICDICGTQIIDRRRKRKCSNECTKTYWERVREAERNENCRPYFWNTFRQEALTRDGRRCTQCGSGKSLEVHHIVPIHAGGTNELGNLTTLCHRCHASLHADERRKLAEERVEITDVRHRAAIVEQHGGRTIEDWISTTSP